MTTKPITTQELLANYLGHLSAGVTSSYPSFARTFCDWLGSRTLDRHAVEAWLSMRRRDGYAAGTIRKEYGIIRAIFRASGVEWPFGTGDAPQIGQREEYAPRFAEDLIAHVIRASLTLRPHHRAFLALSTTYGLRRGEIADITAGDLSWGSNPTLYVETLKHGRQRYHLIPSEIAWVLHGYDFPPRSPAFISLAFIQLKEAAHLPHEQALYVGYHGIRRTLDRILLDGGMSLPEARVFMRWSRNTRDMALRYATTAVIGMEGEHEVEVQDADVDRKAFQLNPWLPLWAELEM